MSHPSDTTSVKARLGISGVLEYRDAAGQVIKRVPISGSVPLTAQQAAELSITDEEHHGTDDRERGQEGGA